MHAAKKIIIGILLSIVFPLLFVGTAFAADFKIIGTTLDNNHNPVPNAKVTVTNVLTSQVVTSTNTDKYGYYLLAVPKGTYNISISPPLESGLQSTTYPHIIVSSDIMLHSNLNPVGKALSSGENATLQSAVGKGKSSIAIIVLVVVFIILAVIGFYLWKKKKPVNEQK